MPQAVQTNSAGLSTPPPGCALRPALPVSRAVSGRAVATDIVGGCVTGVKPRGDRAVKPGDLPPVVQVGGPAHVPGPAAPAWRDGERAEDVAEGPLADRGAQEGDGLG